MIFLSPFFGGACKFYPSCSNYAYEAVQRHGARRGVALAMKRLLRCRPFTKGGYDPVPEISFEQDLLRKVEPSDLASNQIQPETTAHKPTQAVVAETWSGAGTLGVERRL